jgi:hypothetical protein
MFFVLEPVVGLAVRYCFGFGFAQYAIPNDCVTVTYWTRAYNVEIRRTSSRVRRIVSERSRLDTMSASHGDSYETSLESRLLTFQTWN